MSDPLPDTIVAELMSARPETVPVFIRHRMACPGCVMAPFMTVAEAAKEYRVQPEIFVEELTRVITSGNTQP